MPAVFSTTFSFSIALTQAQAAIAREREALENGIAEENTLRPEDVGPINDLISGEVGMVRPSEAHWDLASLLRDEDLSVDVPKQDLDSSSVSGDSSSEWGIGMLRPSEAHHDLASILRSPSCSCCCADLELKELYPERAIGLLRPSPACLDLASLLRSPSCCSVDSHEDDEDVSFGSDESSEDSHSIWALGDQDREIGTLTPSPACLDLASILNPNRFLQDAADSAADGLDDLSAACLDEEDSEQSELEGQITPKLTSRPSFDDWNPPLSVSCRLSPTFLTS